MNRDDAISVLVTIPADDEQLEALDKAVKDMNAISRLIKDVNRFNREVLDEKVAIGFDLAVGLMKKHLGGWFNVKLDDRKKLEATLDVLEERHCETGFNKEF